MAVTTQAFKTTAMQIVAGALVIGLLALGCARSSASELVDEVESVAATTPTTAPAPTTTPEPSPAPSATTAPDDPVTATPVPTASPTPAPKSTIEPDILDEAFLAATAAEVTVTDGAVLLAAFDANAMSAEASAGTDATGNPPTATDPFRVGSVTKVFTAVATLTLVDEGAVDLDTPAAQYVSRVAVPADVTVRHLLQHTSGLFNYTNAPEVWPSLDDSTRAWTPEEVLTTFVADRPPLFEAGSRFSYSNTNYLILGVLLEEVTGQPYHEVLRQRINDPLGLSAATYLAGFEEGPEPFDPYEHNGQVGYDYTALATGAWSAGAVVSSASDLHLFFTALFDNQLIPADLVTQMTVGTKYGLGLELADSNNGLYGHSGAIPQYTTVARHSPELGVTAIAVSTDPNVPAMLLLSKMLRGL